MKTDLVLTLRVARIEINRALTKKMTADSTSKVGGRVGLLGVCYFLVIP